MPVLHMTIYARVARDFTNNTTPIPMTPWLKEERVEIELGKSNQSKPFPQHASFVMVKPELACCLNFGDDPIADDGAHPVDAGEVRWYGVTPGQRLAVIEFS